MSTPDIAEEIIYCTVHPDREATLRCNKCGRPMCVQCAVQTPVGYRCKECVRGIQAKYYNAQNYDDWIALGVAAAAMGVAGYILSLMSLPIFITLILGFPAGGAVGELIVRATQKRRSRLMPYFGAAGVVIGGLGGALVQVYLNLSNVYARYAAEAGIRAADLPPLDLSLVFQAVFSDIGFMLAIGIVAFAVYARLKTRG